MALTSRKRKTITWTAVLVVLGLVIYGMASAASSFSDKLLNDKDGLFEASATILAFVSLGSVLDVRLSSDRAKGAAQFGGIAVVLICSAVVIIIQTAIILWLCCFELYASTYVIMMIVTALCFIVSTLGYMIYVYGHTSFMRDASRAEDED